MRIKAGRAWSSGSPCSAPCLPGEVHADDQGAQDLAAAGTTRHQERVPARAMSRGVLFVTFCEPSCLKLPQTLAHFQTLRPLLPGGRAGHSSLLPQQQHPSPFPWPHSPPLLTPASNTVLRAVHPPERDRQYDAVHQAQALPQGQPQALALGGQPRSCWAHGGMQAQPWLPPAAPRPAAYPTATRVAAAASYPRALAADTAAACSAATPCGCRTTAAAAAGIAAATAAATTICCASPEQQPHIQPAGCGTLQGHQPARPQRALRTSGTSRYPRALRGSHHRR